MVTSDRPTAAPRAMSVEEVEHAACAPLPVIPPELPAKPLHAGNGYTRRPPPRGYPAIRPDSLDLLPEPSPIVWPDDPAYTSELSDDSVQWPEAKVPPLVEPWPPGPGVSTRIWANEAAPVSPEAFEALRPGARFHVAPNTILDRSNTPADDVLPNDARARKAVPAGAVLDYFDSAWVEIAKALQDGNDQHNPGEPLHWARGKSSDHAHCIIRHYLQRGKLAISPTGAVIRHSTYMAIRALMLLQEELEAAGAPLSRGSRLPGEKV